MANVKRAMKGGVARQNLAAACLVTIAATRVLVQRELMHLSGIICIAVLPPPPNSSRSESGSFATAAEFSLSSVGSSRWRRRAISSARLCVRNDLIYGGKAYCESPDDSHGASGRTAVRFTSQILTACSELELTIRFPCRLTAIPVTLSE